MPKDTRKQSSEEDAPPNAVEETRNGAGAVEPPEPQTESSEGSIAVVKNEKRIARRNERALARRKAEAPAAAADGGGSPPIIPATASLTPFPPIGQRPGNPRRLRTTFRSAAIFVGIPTILAILYFGIIASDQFASRADFIIKTRSAAAAGTSGGSLMGGMAQVNPMTIVDMLVVKEYVESAQILGDLSPTVDVRKLFSTHEADSFARLKEKISFRNILTGKVWSEGIFSPVTEEDLLNYWKKMVVVNFDMTTGISTLEVKAFSAQDAKLLADAVLGLSETLVNRLSERSQSDTLTFARNEVNEANKRAVKSLDELEKFSTTFRRIDPEGYAKVRGEIQGKLEADLSEYQSQLETLRLNLPEDAPGIQQIKARIAGLQEQLLVQKRESTHSPTRDSANEMLNEFSKRKLVSEFATKEYLSALESLEMARRDATQQSRYLEAFVRPQVPQKADYPKRLQSIAIVFVASTAIWAIGGLLIAAAKEHL